ncbi:hypothetical protein [Paenibacillus typhae]|uniref:hypothetical protein n=1 Tax=Paenibacillus typhae TaxID=1174501 RepID=UPI001C8CF7AC|nr:hypothetical protein [Paenibacillus typhae]MBY0011500.1 hypothetical protein [Paenibacillus typhae]
MTDNGKNDVVLIELDRPRELRYGHKALKTLVALTGTKVDDINMESLDLGEIEKYVYCGLLSDAKQNNENLKLDDMEDLLDQAPSFGHIVEKITEAFNISFGAFAVPEGNPPTPAEQPAQSLENGTGKNP